MKQNNNIHPLSVVHPEAKIHETVQIGPFTTIYDDVVIEEGTWIGPNVTIFPGSRIGKYNKIYPGAVIGAEPQDLKYNNEYTTVEIGNYVTIRECVTIHRGTEYSYKTVIGNNTLIMAYSHVAHDCVIGNNVVIANATNMAGHVIVDDFAIIGGMTAIHQFCKIGKHVIIQGGSLVKKDVPPYIKAGREPLIFEGLNIVGLKRRGFANEDIELIKNIYRIYYGNGMNISQATSKVEESFAESLYKNEIVNFIKNSQRGVLKGYASNSFSDTDTESE